RDVPPNSHLRFEMIVPLAAEHRDTSTDSWPNNSVFTYLMLRSPTDIQALRKRFPAFMQKYMGSAMRQHGMDFKLEATPLRDVYFEQTVYDGVPHGDKTVVFVFISIAA